MTLDELISLERTATKGPWFMISAGASGCVDDTIATISEDELKERDMSWDEEVLGSSEWLRCSEEDMQLMVALRNAAPDMLQLVSCFRAGDVDQLRGLLSLNNAELVTRLLKACEFAEKIRMGL